MRFNVDEIAFTVLGPLNSVNVVADLVKQDLLEHERTNQRNSKCPRWCVTYHLVDE